MSLLVTQGLTKRFGNLTALDKIDFSLEPGEKRALIGPNGAGKTTLVNVLTGELVPSAGRIFFDGREISGLPAHAIARRGIARTFQIVNLFPRLSVEENVRAAAQVGEPWLRCSARVSQLTEQVLSQVGLTLRASMRVRELSHGDQRLLEIAVALAQRPKLLLLDEPTAGLSPVETQAMTRQISQLRDLTVLIVEHDMRVVLALADKLTVLHRGHILAEGRPEEIASNPEVQDVYLRGSLASPRAQ
jgi:branched-chain amino acid transport system ATP-binding protein